MNHVQRGVSEISPSHIREGSVMQVADDGQGSLLLGVVDQDRVLRRDSINDPVRQDERWDWPGRRMVRVRIDGLW